MNSEHYETKYVGEKKSKTTIPQGRIELPTFAFLNSQYCL